MSNSLPHSCSCHVHGPSCGLCKDLGCEVGNIKRLEFTIGQVSALHSAAYDTKMVQIGTTNTVSIKRCVNCGHPWPCPTMQLLTQPEEQS